MKQYSEHEQRVRKELQAAGMSKYGLLKGETRHLPAIIHPDEHIGGVVYGRRGSESALFVSTNRRMLYLEHKPFFRINDEIAYSVLSGVTHNTQNLFAGVTIHTRLGDYTLTFVNRKCAAIFTAYMDKRRLEEFNGSPAERQTASTSAPAKVSESSMTKAARVFLISHNLGVLSSVDRSGNVTGAAVYYLLSEDNAVYIATKNASRKAQNILIHDQVALTVVDADTRQTVQLQGTAKVETDQRTVRRVLGRITAPHVYEGAIDTPPITKVAAGEYVVMRIMPTDVRYHDYKK